MPPTDTPNPDLALYRNTGTVARVQLNRPDRLNAVSPELYSAIEDRLDEAMNDDARVVVLEGAGRAFCAGADMKQHDGSERTAEERREYVWQAQEACERIQTIPVPVVSQVHGYAIGAGAELALSADFIIAARDAEFRFPEVSLGTYIGGGATYTLAQRVGAARAKELILSAVTLTGDEAEAEGIVTEAVPESELGETTERLADDLAGNAPIPMKFAKAHLSQVGSETRKEMLAGEAEALLTCMETEDWREGIAAFVEDREPKFGGK